MSLRVSTVVRTVGTVGCKDSATGAVSRHGWERLRSSRSISSIRASTIWASGTLRSGVPFAIPKGSLGPVSPPAGTLVVADESLRGDVAWGIGANEDDYHLIGAMPGRDFEVEVWADLVVAEPGDGCPVCGGELQGARGIEVSQVFQLGTKYSEALGATFTADDGSERPFIMGCYGVGITRSLAAVIEQHHDESGIAWPISVAPVEVAVIPLSHDEEVMTLAEEIWKDLASAGVEVIIDDRDERAGVKFADAELIGYPFQLVIGKRGVASGTLELKHRATLEREELPVAEAVQTLVEKVSSERSRFS